jgi:uncharacterized protein (TIGR02147 family)
MKSASDVPYIKIIISEFEKRRAKNAAFSMRAFASYLGLDSGTLSAVIKGKRALSIQQSRDICQRLQLSKEDQQSFLDSIRKQDSLKEFFAMEVRKFRQFTIENSDHERLLEWEHFALEELTRTRGFKNDIRWIADRLNSTPQRIQEVFDRLLETGWLVIDQQGQLRKRTPENYYLYEVSPEQSLKAAQETLSLIQKALTEPAALERSFFTSITLPGDPAKLAIAKELIWEFEARLGVLLEGENPTDVYRLAVGLFPLTK